MITSLYRRFLRPAAALVALCGLVSCLLLLLDADPHVTGLDPDVLVYVLTGVLAVFGVLVPGAIAVRGVSGSPWPSVVGLFLAMTANAIALGGRAVTFPATVPMQVSLVVGLLCCTAGLAAIVDLQASRPPRSKF